MTFAFDRQMQEDKNEYQLIDDYPRTMQALRFSTIAVPPDSVLKNKKSLERNNKTCRKAPLAFNVFHRLPQNTLLIIG